MRAVLVNSRKYLNARYNLDNTITYTAFDAIHHVIPNVSTVLTPKRSGLDELRSTRWLGLLFADRIHPDVSNVATTGVSV